MIKLDAHKSVHFCDGLTRRDFLHAGALGHGRSSASSLTDLFALKAAGAVDPANDVNCICLFLVGAPSQLDTWDMKPDAPAEIRGPYKPIKTNVPGIQICEIFPRMAHARRQVRADPIGALRRRRRPRRRPPDDADRPPLPGRHRERRTSARPRLSQGPEGRRPAARAAAAPDRQHRRQHAARPERRLPRQASRPVRRSNADPSDPAFQVPDLLPPDYDHARFAPTGAATCATLVDGAVQELRGQPRRAAARRLVRSGLHADLVGEGARGVRPVEGARQASKDRYGRNRFGRAACSRGGWWKRACAS